LLLVIHSYELIAWCTVPAVNLTIAASVIEVATEELLTTVGEWKYVTVSTSITFPFAVDEM
jgi:hypothetical protein